jgi:hypothetical protein
MAATTATTMIQRVRRTIGDWPELDTLTASIASGGSTITVADGTIYTTNSLIQIDQELLRVTANGTGTTAAVAHGLRGTSAASHASGVGVLLRPSFFDVEIIDSLNAGIAACWPYIYKPVIDTTLTTTSETWEYTIPTMPSDTDARLAFISDVQIKPSGETKYLKKRDWRIERGTTPKLVFKRSEEANATIKLVGYGPFLPLASSSSSLDVLFPRVAEFPLVEYATAWLLAAGEAHRVRVDTHYPDQRENANRTGSSTAASNAMLQRFQLKLRTVAMPPLPTHVLPVI